MSELPERIKRLNVSVRGAPAGVLARDSQYVFTYVDDQVDRPAVSLLMPASTAVYTDGDLFPVMDMNLPEGYLFQRIVELYAKRPLSKMHLLALMGQNGIGRLGYSLGEAVAPPAPPLSKADLLNARTDEAFFRDLVSAYLSTGAGVSGVQPKIMVPSRASVPVPDMIVKSAGAQYPGLAANEFVCLSAARKAGIAVPGFDLSVQGDILVVDRFDIDEQGHRHGFEDIAALMGLRVHDRLSDRKYSKSYDLVARVISMLSSRPGEDLHRFFEQLAFSIMVRNGDAHLKNFGLLYANDDDAQLAPMFDVVTTTVYTYERPGGFEDVDRTLALKLRVGKAYTAKAYPVTDELLAFGREVCRVARPESVVQRIGDAMSETLRDATRDERIPPNLLRDMAAQWEIGLGYARDAGAASRR
jgi:serine/threonine-protein kinase HipA